MHHKSMPVNENAGACSDGLFEADERLNAGIVVVTEVLFDAVAVLTFAPPNVNTTAGAADVSASVCAMFVCELGAGVIVFSSTAPK
jgi:hypothetical protein